MEIEEIINLLQTDLNTKQTPEYYYNLINQINIFKTLTPEKLLNLRQEVIKYYDFVIDNFSGFSEYIQHIAQNQSITAADELISERFSQESYKEDLKLKNNNTLYKKTFYELKEEYIKIQNAWKKGIDPTQYFNQITNILNILTNSKKNTINIFKNKDNIIEYLTFIADTIKNSSQNKEIKNKLQILDEISSLINTIIINKNTVHAQEILINKLANKIPIQEYSFYSNDLIYLLRNLKKRNKNYITLSNLSNSDFQTLKNMILNCAKNTFNSQEIIEYYSTYIINNLNKYLYYEPFNKNCTIYISAILNLTDNINYANQLVALFSNTIKFDFSKVNAQIYNQIKQLIIKLSQDTQPEIEKSPNSNTHKKLLI